MAEELLSTLDEKPNMAECRILDTFIRENSKSYQFDGDIYMDIISKILNNRLNIQEFALQKDFYSYILKLLQCIRILSRDASLHEAFDDIEKLAILLTKYADDYFLDTGAQFISEMLVELTSILRRIHPDKLLDFEIPKILSTLLGTQHSLITRSVLETLISIVNVEDAPELFMNTNIIEMLLRIVNEYTRDYQLLALNMLGTLASNEEFARQVSVQRGTLLLINLLYKEKDGSVRLALLSTIQVLCENMDCVAEFRLVGLINTLLKGLQVCDDPLQNIATLSVLTHMAKEDESCIKIRFIGSGTIAQCLLDHHPQLISTDDHRPSYEIQLYALRCLRFLFSVERNRKQFKTLFVPQLYASFIDVGNYVEDVVRYQETLKILNNLSKKDLSQLEINIEDIKDTNAAPLKSVGGYRVIELIGKGAFGSVYEVEKGDNHYALKEIPLAELENNIGGNNRAAEDISKEVAIYKELEHPNIIKYYTSFVEGESLFILMELIDGQDLSDYISSLIDKCHKLNEGQIWRLFIQMCTALRYLHMDKRVVHRDLSPKNIMITRDLQVKIADFGLAKQRESQSSGFLKSFVGTVLYSCPEIVQNLPYNEKADIWSLGCILYELSTLKQPFSAENPLTLARKIVEEDYDVMDDDEFTPLLRTVVRKCMTADQDARPDILQVSQLIAPILMAQVDELRTSEQQLKGKIKRLIEKPSTVQTPLMSTTPGSLRKVEDPTLPLFEWLHKMIFISQMSQGIDKDSRVMAIDSFKHWLFSSHNSSAKLKIELSNLMNCVDSAIPMISKDRITYEKLNQNIEEILTETNYYENRTPFNIESLRDSL